MKLFIIIFCDYDIKTYCWGWGGGTLVYTILSGVGEEGLWLNDAR